MARERTALKLEGVGNKNDRDGILCNKQLGQKSKKCPIIYPPFDDHLRIIMYSGVEKMAKIRSWLFLVSL